MAQRAGRLTCPRCGANNFETVTACWKCGAPLGGTAGAPPQTGFAPAYAAEPARPPAVGYVSGAYAGDPGVARRAAIALALTLPWIGLPVGWVFMMIEDSRRQAIGRLCAVWSLIGLCFHMLLMVAAAGALEKMLITLLPAVEAAARNRNGAGGGGLDSNSP